MDDIIVTAEETVATTQLPLNSLELFNAESDIVHYSQEILVRVINRQLTVVLLYFI